VFNAFTAYTRLGLWVHYKLHHCHLQDRELFLKQLDDTENWLYEDGECESKQIYTDRLSALKVCCALTDCCGQWFQAQQDACT